MSEEASTALPVRHDDLSLLFRRCELEKQGVTFAQAPPAIGMPRYPLRWVASRDGDKSDPMTMPDLIPHVEETIGEQL